MTSILDKFKKVANLPWSIVFSVAAAGFVTAAVVTTTTSFFMVPQDLSFINRNAKAGLARTSDEEFDFSGPTLDQDALDVIYKRNIFNSEGEIEDAKGTKDDKPKSLESKEDLVKTGLPLKLMGTIYGGDPFSGIAVVQNTTKRAINSFMVQDVLMENATVVEIHREKIIIDNNGRKEYLELEKTELVRRRRGNAVASRLAPSGGFGAPAVMPIATTPPPKSYKEEGFERQGTQIDMSCDYRQRLLTTDFTKVLQDAKASPNIVDGELRGFELTRIRQDSIYEKSGLQNGDIVTEVNGVPLRNTAQAIKLLNSLRGENEIEVRVNRGGVPVTVLLNIRC